MLTTAYPRRIIRKYDVVKAFLEALLIEEIDAREQDLKDERASGE